MVLFDMIRYAAVVLGKNKVGMRGSASTMICCLGPACF